MAFPNRLDSSVSVKTNLHHIVNGEHSLRIVKCHVLTSTYICPICQTWFNHPVSSNSWSFFWE